MLNARKLGDVNSKSPAYLDHAATTPMLAQAIAAAAEQMATVGNPSSLHGAGRAARRVVEESREQMAKLLGCRPSEIVFTGGGTEADNLAIKGLFWARQTCEPQRKRILISSVEHHAVLDPAFWLAEHSQAEIVLLDVDDNGLLDIPALKRELAEHNNEIALISVMWANNEVGSIQPLDQVVAAAKTYGIPVHSDAVQAVGHVPVDFTHSGLAAMTMSAHKLGGPVGIGALVAQRGLKLTPVIHGGGQERSVRSGTLDTAGIRSFAVALKSAVENQEAEAARLTQLRNELVAGVLAACGSATLRGPALDSGLRLPANAHFTFAGCEGDSLIYLLDSHGVQASTGSACQAGVPQPSHVLLAMGLEETTARGALRFTLGNTSTKEDVAQLLEALPTVVERATAAGLAATGIGTSRARG